MRNLYLRFASLSLLFATFWSILPAQTITGSVVGSVIDPAGLAVTNAEVSLVHTQFSAVDATARFDAQGRQVNDRFGEYTASRSPRIM